MFLHFAFLSCDFHSFLGEGVGAGTECKMSLTQALTEEWLCKANHACLLSNTIIMIKKRRSKVQTPHSSADADTGGDKKKMKINK